MANTQAPAPAQKPVVDFLKHGGPFIFGVTLLRSKADRMTGNSARGPYDMVSIMHTVAIGDPETGQEKVDIIETFDAPPNAPSDAVFRSAFPVPSLGQVCAFQIEPVMKGKGDNRKVVLRLRGIFPVVVG